MNILRVLAAGACLLAGTAAIAAQELCSVTAHGAKGDCKADDTAAFQEAADKCGSFFIPRQPASSACYRVHGVRLRGGSIVTFEDRSTAVWPATPQTKYIFLIAGKGMDAKARYTTIRNGALGAPFAMAEGTAGIRIEYGDHIRLEDLSLDGFYNDVFADNTSSLYLQQVTANGAANANLWVQQSDVRHGDYFGGPLYVEHSTLGSCDCSAASIWVQDIAVVGVTDSDVLGVKKGHGFAATSSNGLPGTPPDYPANIHLHGDTFDSVAGTVITISNYIKSDIEGTWVSGGRPLEKPCIEMDQVQDVSISNSHVFWCGADGLNLGHTTGVKVMGSTFSGLPGTGIHLVAAARSSIIGNSCAGERFNGNGSPTQKFCIYEEPSARDNFYLANDASGTVYGNSLQGSTPTVRQKNAPR